MWSRIHLIPLLTAEEDRDLVRRHWADQAREKELMGKTTSPYNSDRYVDFFLGRWVGGGGEWFNGGVGREREKWRRSLRKRKDRREVFALLKCSTGRRESIGKYT